MMDIKEVLLQCFLNFVIKKSTLLTDKSASTGHIKNEICHTSNCLKDYNNQFLENLKK